MPDKIPPVMKAIVNASFFELVFGQSMEQIPEHPDLGGATSALPSGEQGDGGEPVQEIQVPAEKREIMRLLGHLNEICYTNGVNTLRDPKCFPNPRLNATVEYLWRLSGNEISVTLMDRPGNLRFWMESHGKKKIATVLLPANFYVTCHVEPLAQMEAIAFVSSMVKDYKLGRTTPKQHMNWRATGYDAEVLRMAVAMKPDLVLNDTQSKILEFLPDGLDSLPPDMLY